MFDTEQESEHERPKQVNDPFFTAQDLDAIRTALGSGNSWDLYENNFYCKSFFIIIVRSASSHGAPPSCVLARCG